MTKRYYYLANSPDDRLSKMDLRLKKIGPDTQVCPEETRVWQRAGDVPDLQDLFPAPPPPTSAEVETPPLAPAAAAPLPDEEEDLPENNIENTQEEQQIAQEEIPEENKEVESPTPSDEPSAPDRAAENPQPLPAPPPPMQHKEKDRQPAAFWAPWKIYILAGVAGILLSWAVSLMVGPNTPPKTDEGPEIPPPPPDTTLQKDTSTKQGTPLARPRPSPSPDDEYKKCIAELNKTNNEIAALEAEIKDLEKNEHTLTTSIAQSKTRMRAAKNGSAEKTEFASKAKGFEDQKTQAKKGKGEKKKKLREMEKLQEKLENHSDDLYQKLKKGQD